MVALLKAAHRLHLADSLEVISQQEGEVAIPASLLQRGVRDASEALRVDVMQLCCMGTASTKPPSKLVTGRGSAVRWPSAVLAACGQVHISWTLHICGSVTAVIQLAAWYTCMCVQFPLPALAFTKCCGHLRRQPGAERDIKFHALTTRTTAYPCNIHAVL